MFIFRTNFQNSERSRDIFIRVPQRFIGLFCGERSKLGTCRRVLTSELTFRNFSKNILHNPRVETQRCVSDAIFDVLSSNKLQKHNSLTDIRKSIEETGLQWETDPRLEGIRNKLVSLKNESIGTQTDPLLWNRDGLFHLVGDDANTLTLLARAFSNQFVIPDFEEFTLGVQNIFEIVETDKSGFLATYIPQLAKEDPTKFGLSLCTIDGQRFDVGDANVPFCLQSCVKPLQYAIAVTDHTSHHVHQHIGKEASGNLFNAIMLNSDEQPHNPMINAGALVVCSLIKPEFPIAERFDHVQTIISKMAANEYISFNNSVFQSEKATCYRNRALAYYLKEKNCFPLDSDVEENLDLYHQLCAVKMTCASASVATATLANGGVCPLRTGQQILDTVSVRNTLALMHSCGMYDYSGVFAFHVGLPAKSGVHGGLMLVVPNVMGISLWSPLLDERGNTVRGVKFCKEFIRKFNFHIYDNLKHSEKKSDPRLKKESLTVNQQHLLASLSVLQKEMCNTS